MEYAAEKSAPIIPSLHEHLVKTTTEACDVELIFCSPGPTPPLLTILISRDREPVPGDLVNSLNEIFEDYPTMKHRVYTLNYAAEELKTGNLYFIRNCLCGSLLYIKCSIPLPKILHHTDIPKALQKAETWFCLEMDKIKAFKAGADFYKSQKNYAHAAYLIHQTIELLYRCLENFAMGKSRACHRIINHMEYAHPFIHDAFRLFKKDDPQEEQLLELLDQAYCDTRYTNSYKIKIRDLNLLFIKAEIMACQVRDIFQFRLEDCYDHLKRETKEYIKNRDHEK